MKRLFLPLMMLCLLFVGKAQAQEELTVYDGNSYSNVIPAYIFYFDDFTRSQFVIPAEDLSDMEGGVITSLKFYVSDNTSSYSYPPYTTVSTADVYMMEVDYTTITGLEPKANGTIVYSGTLDLVLDSKADIGSMTINFSMPYIYEGGNLLIGIENTTDAGYKNIYFSGSEVTGASFGGYDSNSLDGVTGSQRNFIPKTTFIYEPGDVTCPKPKNLAINNVGPHSADLTWTAGGEETAWLVAAVPAGTDIEDLDPSMAIPVMGTPAYTFTNLDPETDYVAAVAASCTGEFSLPRTINFTTDIACPAPTDLEASNITTSSADIAWTGYSDSYSLRYRPLAPGGPFEANFDDSSLEGWTTIDADGDGYNWVLGSEVGGIYLVAGATLAGTGYNSSADFVTSGSYSNVVGELTPDNYLVAPAHLVNSANATVSFWACGQDSGYPAEHFGVAISTSSNTDASAFTTIQEWTLTAKSAAVNNAPYRIKHQGKRGESKAQGTWYQYTVNLGAYVGQNIYVAIRHFNCTDQFMLDVDDFVINDEAADVAEWVYVSADDAEATLNNLDPDTAYEVQVEGDCSNVNDGFSVWSQTLVFTTLPSCPRPTDVTVTDITNHEATVTWTPGESEQQWIVILGNEEFDATTTSYTLTGLDAETDYTVEVVAVCSADDQSQPASATFTTAVACEQPTNIQVAVQGVDATVTWDGTAQEYNLRYREYVAPAGATVTLTAPDVWGDGSGYQMLLDADANTYGSIIPETGALTSGGDVPASIYNEFEYKIPEEADGALSTSNIVINNSISILIPAGTYDWCITNPTAGDRMWIASSNGNIGGRYDDYVFESGLTYEFTVSMGTQNDQVDLTITGAKATTDDEEWTVITGITGNTYTIEGLADTTNYEVQVQAVCGGVDGESVWSEPSVKFVTEFGDGVNEMADGINVWNRTGEIRVDLTNGGNYTMNVVNILGQTVMTSNVNGMGSHIVKHNLTAGVYVVTLSSADNTFSTKIVVR